MDDLWKYLEYTLKELLSESDWGCDTPSIMASELIEYLKSQNEIKIEWNSEFIERRNQILNKVLNDG